MCFRTEADDPTQQPIIISQSGGAHDGESQDRRRKENGKKQQSNVHSDIGPHQRTKQGVTNTTKTAPAQSGRAEKARRRRVSSGMMGFGG
ncbi:hypothetical protein A1O3_09028 [Capronia epimyces CBS 606.96]|uniref:Uncharacterized protein n=1 Tax=Capronia epimyces CBS 606.96 TaxID=1182542 RepID=W9Y638_9EURO|nr:uncharacterized protein A1O3_09028 [Capronia epimyces CBS 606.96]EXJ77869.1 hypothetical protein A1O3_09028 [Capronia epimyces CBS 606.96]